MPHLLKRLELNGFKSFANKTVLEFPHGITAIVGPNGSGKSNVIDAIRWLLGERDAKSLRGAKSEDLIFAGTPKRPRVGRAEASLHFENSQKFFPVEFGEVSVMREVTRDGESRYFLNKSEVRLKDIVDFFAGARLGSRGITVITQGNSDMFIRATPTERREMIEEVLGLKEYQLKKHEAERRLKSSEINLDKTAALIEEILPHLRSLKRQTGRFEKRDEYQSELSELEAQFFGSQLAEITSRLATVEKELREHEKRQMELAVGKNHAEDKLKLAEANEPKERAELKSIKESIRTIEEKRNDLSRELAKLEAQIEAAAKHAAAVEGVSPGELLALVREAKASLEKALHDPAALEAAARAVIKNIDKAFDKEIKEEAESAPLRKEFGRVASALKDIEAEIGALREKEKTLEKNQESFYGVFKAAMEELQRARASLDEWTRAEQAKPWSMNV
jgi:chromosome segregation protein